MERRFAFVIEKPADLSQQWNTNTLRPLAPMPPLGVLSLAALLLERDWTVRVYDNSLEQWTVDRLMHELNAFRPTVVGLSMTSLNAPASLELAAMLARQGVPVLAGGPHVSVLALEVAAAKGIIAAVAGEAEEVIVQLAEAAANHQTIPLQPGIFTRQGGQGVTKPPMNLDALPLPARELVPIERYGRRLPDISSGPIDSLATSRGCPFRCTFCSNSGVWSNEYRRHRTRSAAYVADEMEYLSRRYGSQGFFFREDNMTPTRRHVVALCEEFTRRRFPWRWKCEAHVSTVDEPLLEQMAAAGMKTLWLGIETGSDRMLRKIGKGFTIEQARKILTHARKIGVRTASSFLLGLPDQTEEDIHAAVQLAEDTEMDEVWFQVYIGYPGSYLYHQVKEAGQIEAQWHSIIIPRSPLGGFAESLAWEQKMRAHFRERYRARQQPAV